MTENLAETHRGEKRHLFLWVENSHFEKARTENSFTWSCFWLVIFFELHWIQNLNFHFQNKISFEIFVSVPMYNFLLSLQQSLINLIVKKLKRIQFRVFKTKKCLNACNALQTATTSRTLYIKQKENKYFAT